MVRARRGVAGQEKKSDTPQREYKSVSFVLESADESTGEFSGYAAVFGNVDSGGDVIEKGAFTKTIAADFARIKILSQHNSYDLPIGKPLELLEILSFMDAPDADPPPAEPDDPPKPTVKPKKNADPKKQTKNAGIIFEIIPNKTGGKL